MDIHIGTIRKLKNDRGIAQVVYHVPINNPVTGVVPSPTSIIDSQLDQAEKDALAAGTLKEIIKNITITKTQTQSEIAVAIKSDFVNQANAFNSDFDFMYKFYGVSFNA